MSKKLPQNKECCAGQNSQSLSSSLTDIQPHGDRLQEEVCCGSPPGPQSSRYERPGYALLQFVDGFLNTPIGPVPRVKTELDHQDYLGMIRVRLGIKRDHYKVAPGLYCIGTPGPGAPVLVTANYKLTFDLLRRELAALNVWILVLDTRGINVWCSAGKAIFSTSEVVQRVKITALNKVVEHNQLILPQLAATGVAAHDVKRESGFKVIWGPVRVKDIKPFLDNGLKADKSMRQVTFSLLERLQLIPVELSALPKPSCWILVAVFLLSGIGTNFFSFAAAWSRGLMVAAAYAGGVLSGAVAAPALLPWIPGRSFALKGAITGLIGGAGVVAIFRGELQTIGALGLLFCSIMVSSYLAMNFTGSTPFTSPSGVEKEMRKAIPLQVIALLSAVAAWVGSAFAG